MALNVGTNLIAFVIVLGFLIFAHEAGHFLLAKLFRVRVLVFSFGFGKKLFGFVRGGTDYRVSLFPLGGYVRMAGDTPEAESENALEGHDEEGIAKGAPDEYLSRPKWQRFLILFAGPAANVVIAVVFLTWLNIAGTMELAESRAMIGTVSPGKPAAAAGFQTGDLIVEANGDAIREWNDFRLVIGMNPAKPIEVRFLRGGVEKTTLLTPERQVTEFGVSGFAGLSAYIESIVGRIQPGTAADRAGLKLGDRIVAINDKPVAHWSELAQALEENAGKTSRLDVIRNGSMMKLALDPPAAKTEIYPGFIPPTRIKRLPPIEAFRESIAQNWKMTKYTFIVIGRMFRAEGSVKDFTGPISIARISGEMLRTGWKEVISLMAVISLNLGIMNLLPIPVLDGGHIFILLLEGVARREFSLKAKERIQQVGFAALAALMIVVLYNDVLQNVMRLRQG